MKMLRLFFAIMFMMTVVYTTRAEARPLRVMALGDSITASSCWRSMLWTLAKSTTGRPIDFIGTRKGGACGVSGFDDANEGHNCYVTADLLNSPGTGRKKGCEDGDVYRGDAGDLLLWFSMSNMPVAPDVILVHLGTNDVIKKVEPQRTLDALTMVVGTLRNRNPATVFLVAKIIPMDKKIGDVTKLNEALHAWVSLTKSELSPIYFVDMNTGFNLAMTRDGLHPNDLEGSEFMAKRWFQALQPYR